MSLRALVVFGPQACSVVVKWPRWWQGDTGIVRCPRPATYLGFSGNGTWGMICDEHYDAMVTKFGDPQLVWLSTR